MIQPRLVQHLEAAHAGHLHVEKQQIRRESFDGAHRVSGTANRTDDLDVGLADETQLDALASERLIIHDQRADGAHTGISILTTAPRDAPGPSVSCARSPYSCRSRSREF